MFSSREAASSLIRPFRPFLIRLTTGEVVRATVVARGKSVRIATKRQQAVFSDSQYLGNADIELGNADPSTPSPVKRRKTTAQPVPGVPRPGSSPLALDEAEADLTEDDDTDVYCSTDEEQASSDDDDLGCSGSGDREFSAGDKEDTGDKANAEADVSSADEDSGPAHGGVPPLDSNPIENDDCQGKNRTGTQHGAEEVHTIDPYVNDSPARDVEAEETTDLDPSVNKSPDGDGDLDGQIEALRNTIRTRYARKFTNITIRRRTEQMQRDLEYLIQRTMDHKEQVAGYSRSAGREETGSGIFSSVKQEPVSSDTLATGLPNWDGHGGI